MPTLGPADSPITKLDTDAVMLQAALNRQQRRDLFEQPGTVVVAIVELRSTTYTGYIESEDKPPQVKLRVIGCEVAQTQDEAKALREARRAMYRNRQINGTLDEVGNGLMSAEAALDGVFGGYPTEAEFKAHERAKERERRDEYVR